MLMFVSVSGSCVRCSLIVNGHWHFQIFQQNQMWIIKTDSEIFAVPFRPNTLLYFSSFRLAGEVEASDIVWQHDDDTTEGTTTLSTAAKGNFWFDILSSFLLSWVFTQAFLTLLKRYIKHWWMHVELKLLQCVAIQSFVS